MLRTLGIALSLGALTGCGTIASTKIEYGPRIYGGVRYDVDDLAVQGFPLGTLCGLLDFPFSFVADTVMLPYTVVVAITAEPASVVVIDGYVLEAEKATLTEVEVTPSGPLPGRLKPIAGAKVTLGSETATTSASGYFSLRRKTSEAWETFRIEAPGFRTVDVDVSELRSLDNRKYWLDHSVRIRMKRR